MKRILSALLVLLFVVQLSPAAVLAANESGSPKHIPRIVSVVFDDSGSMYKDTDRWAYTSYAMQAFTAMMSDEDVLYVTYLNAPSGTVKIDLSESAKQENIDNIEKTMFGGGTPNKLNQGAECLKTEYKKYGADAKYYLVVLADGLLDAGQGEMSTELGKVAKNTASALSGADFETIYFSMLENANVSISGVTGHTATTGSEIVEVLRNISADIMGRTNVDFKVSGGKVSFDLDYPALSIAVFVQKQNAEFSNVRVPVKRNGKSVSYDTGVFYVDCPTEIVKNMYTSVYTEKVPVNPPSGFVTLIENGNSSIAKGSYTIDLSAYDISKNDLVVLVEPAVKLGCKYYIGDGTKALSFEEMKKLVREGDCVTVECGLYEMNPDGSLGDAVPENVLSPEYKLYVNDTAVGKKLGDNKYEITVGADYANKPLKVEAVLKGYQPFILRETFGDVLPKIAFNPDGGEAHSQMTLTKPEYEDWINGSKQIKFSLVSANSGALKSMSVRVEGIKGLEEGVCSELSNVSVSGNDVVYKPKLDADTEYSKLPKSFRVVLVDDTLKEDIASVTVNVIQPEYKLETVNQLKDVPLNLGMLKDNAESVGFKLTVCYDGSGKFSPVSDYDCEKEISFSVDSGVLSGDVQEKDGGIYFTPKYDSAVNTDISPADIAGKEHTVSASATVDGVSVKSEEVTLFVVGGSYKIEIENLITDKLNLDNLKTNTQKIVFRIYADYSGDGNYGAVADWDTEIFDKLEITTGKLPGTVSVERDENGSVIGKSFTPLYDENNDDEVVFTEVAGRTHTIIGKITDSDVSAEAAVEVLAPNYEIIVQKDGFSVLDTDLRENEDGIEFIIMRDGRALNKRELEGFAPYNIELSKNSKKLVMRVTAIESEDGAAYLCCVPVYEGWWWTCFIAEGEVEARLILGEKNAVGTFEIDRDFKWRVFWTVAAIILAVILWLILCWVTTVKIAPGKFYVAKFKKDGGKWKYDSQTSTSSYRFFILSLRLRKKQRKPIQLADKIITVFPAEDISSEWSLFAKNDPVFDPVAARKEGVYITKNLTRPLAQKIIKKESFKHTFGKIDSVRMKVGAKSGVREAKISVSNALYYEKGNELFIAFYVPKEK